MSIVHRTIRSARCLHVLLSAVVGLWAVANAEAQDSASVRPGASHQSTAQRVAMSLDVGAPVPWRLALFDAPPRLAVDIRNADPLSKGAWAAFAREDPDISLSERERGWSRLTILLDGPMEVAEAEMQTGLEDGRARIEVSLRATTHAAFLSQIQHEAHDALTLPPIETPAQRTAVRDPATFVVMIDPGHGGIDPGAVREGIREADIALTFAGELRAALKALAAEAANLDVRLTRDVDVFVSLEGRVAAAQEARADVFVSIHADALAEGIARGAQVYTLSDEASSSAAAQLAARHNRSDLLGGVDLADQDDQIANILMEITQAETRPKAEALADTLVASMREASVRLHGTARETAGFAVLKAPEIPSVLVEIGFMSSPGELEKLLSPDWRAHVAAALARGLLAWRQAEARQPRGLGQ